MQFDRETQTQILRVAGDRSEGLDIDEVDERIAHILDMHPEFDATWELGEMAMYPQEIDGKVVNPFVHTVLHVIVDKQIQDGSPYFVLEAYQRLIEAGIKEHDVLHSIMGVFAEQHFGTFKKGDNFSNLDYQEHLTRLKSTTQTG